MQVTLTVIDVSSNEQHDIVLTADPASTVGEVAGAIGSALRGSDADAQALAQVVVPLSRDRTPAPPVQPKTGQDQLGFAGRALDPALSLRHSGLQDGCIVTLGAAGAGEPAEPTGVIELRVVGGPGAGGVHRLGLGVRMVGLAPISGVAVADPTLADEHVRLAVGPTSLHVAPMPGRVIQREGQPVPEEGVWWQPGELVEAGNTLLSISVPTRPDAALRPTDDGGRSVDRPPRRQSDFGGAHLEVPLNRSSGKRDKKANTEYADAMAKFNTDLWSAAHHDALARRHEAPDPAEVLLTALGPRRRLWERRRDDVDALQLRLGLANLPSRIELLGPAAAHVTAPPAWSVPVTVSLRELGVLGLAGPSGARTALARWLLLQAAVLHAPSELSIVILAADGWEWVRWLPHLRPRRDQDAAILVGNDPDTAARRTAELTALIAKRGEPVESAGARAGRDFTPVLVLLDNSRPVRQLGGMQSVLTRGPSVGVFTICLDDEEHLLPEECRAIVGFDRADPARVHVASTGAQERRDVLADQVSAPYARQVARALAPLREVDGGQARAAEAGVRLLDRLDLDPPTPERIVDGWGLATASTTAVLGANPDGSVAIDLRRHGPHCLVTGATGAATSELLQTLIAALAVGNRPDALSFILIDGNTVDGGQSATFDECAKLPHIAGVVSEPDKHMALRVVESLIAEVRRRERLVSSAGAKDFDEYLTRPKPASAANTPRLVIVIDEFAPLVQALPDLAVGLIDIARRGQSLGVHLIVATARPTEVISPSVGAILNLRLALRMTDEAQSEAVIGVPDAARIPTSAPGHGYALLGPGMLVPFDTARVTGRRPGSGTPITVTVLPWAAAGQPLSELPSARAAINGDTRTDLAELISAICDAAEELQLASVPSPWLQPLAESVTDRDLTPAEIADDAEQIGRVAPAPYALADLPAQRRHQSVYFDVERDGNLIVIGAEQSGRSTLLRSIARSIATGTSPHDVRLEVIDCGSDALRTLASLPHCASTLTEEDTDELEALLGQLTDEVNRRQELLARDGYADLAQLRSADERLPYIVVLLDCWEDFLAEYEETADSELIDRVFELLTTGPAVGVKFVLSVDRGGLVGRLTTTDADRILLRLDDPADYQLAGADRSRLPTEIPPGRGWHSRAGAEVQIAEFPDNLRPPTPTPALTPTPAVPAPVAVPAPPQDTPAPQPHSPPGTLPTRITTGQTNALESAEPGPATALVGIGLTDEILGLRYLSLVTDGPGLLVAGPAKSGRSTTLATMLKSLLARGRQAVVVSPRPSPLRAFVGAPGVVAVFDGLAAAEDVQAAWEATPSPKVLIVDDLELFGPGSQMNQALARLLPIAEEAGDGIVAAGNSTDLSGLTTGFGVAIRQSRSGVLLAPTSAADGELFGLPSTPSGLNSPGRGFVVRDGAADEVQVATPSDD